MPVRHPSRRGELSGLEIVVSATHYASNKRTILVDDDTIGSTATVNLPTAVGKKEYVYIIKKLGSTANVVIDPFGSETVDGQSTATIVLKCAALRIESDNANWVIT